MRRQRSFEREDGTTLYYQLLTTGLGKALASFKTSMLLKEDPDIHKFLFVVDRKDLDRQTLDEFRRYQGGCVEENTNTRQLVSCLLIRDYAD